MPIVSCAPSCAVNDSTFVRFPQPGEASFTDYKDRCVRGCLAAAAWPPRDCRMTSLPLSDWTTGVGVRAAQRDLAAPPEAAGRVPCPDFVRSRPWRGARLVGRQTGWLAGRQGGHPAQQRALAAGWGHRPLAPLLGSTQHSKLAATPPAPAPCHLLQVGHAAAWHLGHRAPRCQDQQFARRGGAGLPGGHGSSWAGARIAGARRACRLLVSLLKYSKARNSLRVWPAREAGRGT